MIRKKLIEANLRLVIFIAKRYYVSEKGVSFLDLIQEGNIGLMKAIDKYDINKGVKFSTYATYWIKQNILRYFDNHGRTIRIPIYQCQNLNKYVKLKEEFFAKNGRWGTYQELAQFLDKSLDEIFELETLLDDPVSLNMPLDNDDGFEETLGDFVVSSVFESPEDSYDSLELRDTVEKFFDCLNERETKILKLRLGFEKGKIYTYEEIGRTFGVTRQRVSQIEERALKKIRSSSGVNKLKYFYEN